MTALASLVAPKLSEIQNPQSAKNGKALRSFLADLLLGAQALGGAGGTQVDLVFDAATELTISSGTVVATQAAHTIDTEGDAASDDLDTITGGAAEEIIVIRPASAARTVVLKHAIGANRFACLGGRDISLAEVTDFAILYNDGTQWAVLAACTLADGILATANIWTLLQTFNAGIAAKGPISFKDATDATKILALAMASITTGQTRTLTMADENLDLGEFAKRIRTSSASETTIKAIPAASRVDGTMVVDLTNDVAWIFDAGSAAGASAWVLVPDAGTGRWLRKDASLADLASTATGMGAALIGIIDAGSMIAAATVELALAELAARIVAPSASETAIKAIPAAARADGSVVVDLTNDVLWVFDAGSVAGASSWVLVPDVGTGRWLRKNASLADLASVASGLGASLIGIQDVGGMIAALTVELALAELAGRTVAPSASETAIKAIPATARANGSMVVDLTNDVIWTFDAGSAAGASSWVLVPDVGTGRWLRKDASLADLASTSSGLGAMLIGIVDAAGFIAATTVEGALAELAARVGKTIVHPHMTAAAESGNAIAVTIALKDLNNTVVNRTQRCLVELRDANGVISLVGAFTAAISGGAAVSANTKPSVIFDTDANGGAVISVADVSTVYTGVIYVVVTPLTTAGGTVNPGTPEVIAITFA